VTRRYANLVTADLQAVHERVSLLRTEAIQYGRSGLHLGCPDYFCNVYRK